MRMYGDKPTQTKKSLVDGDVISGQCILVTSAHLMVI